VAGLALSATAEIPGHVPKMAAARHALAGSLATGQQPSATPPYGEAGAAAATRDELLAGIHAAEARLAAARVLAAGGPTYRHAELGALSARGWILFIGLHAAAHLHQAAAVVRAR